MVRVFVRGAHHKYVFEDYDIPTHNAIKDFEKTFNNECKKYIEDLRNMSILYDEMEEENLRIAGQLQDSIIQCMDRVLNALASRWYRNGVVLMGSPSCDEYNFCRYMVVSAHNRNGKIDHALIVEYAFDMIETEDRWNPDITFRSAYVAFERPLPIELLGEITIPVPDDPDHEKVIELQINNEKRKGKYKNLMHT